MVVTHVVRLDAALYWGGGEIQAERTREAMIHLGTDVRTYSPLERELGDLFHFFGNFEYYDEIAQHLRARGVPYVVSPIFVTHRSLARLTQRSARQRVLGQFPKGAQRLLQGARELYTLSEREEANLHVFFGDTLPAMHRFPNGVEERFATGNPSLFRAEFGIEGPFVLQLATIEPDKNQMALIRACGEDMKAVIIGRTNDKSYLEQCKRAAARTGVNNVRILDPIPHDSPMLTSALAAAHVFCLPSRRELFPLSAMEATVAGCRLVLADRWGSRGLWEDDAVYINPDDVGALRKALIEEFGKARLKVRSDYLARYSWEAVASGLIERYRKVLE